MQIAFAGQTVLVTGAAHGFGRAIATAFGKRGARVWACDLIEAELRETQARIRMDSGNCEIAVVDVAQPTAVIDFINSAVRGSGRIDVVVNNAGGVLGQTGKALEQVTYDEWQSIFDVNCSGAFFVAQAVAPFMKARKSGRIINISGVAGLGISPIGIQAYAAANAAQIGLTRQLAHELGPWGITVNNIAPGFVRSSADAERQWVSYGEAGQHALVESIALRRLGTPDDIAHAALFFASPYAGWVTGQVLAVDGGR